MSYEHPPEPEFPDDSLVIIDTGGLDSPEIDDLPRREFFVGKEMTREEFDAAEARLMDELGQQNRNTEGDA